MDPYEWLEWSVAQWQEYTWECAEACALAAQGTPYKGDEEAIKTLKTDIVCVSIALLPTFCRPEVSDIWKVMRRTDIFEPQWGKKEWKRLSKSFQKLHRMAPLKLSRSRWDADDRKKDEGVIL